MSISLEETKIIAEKRLINHSLRKLGLLPVNTVENPENKPNEQSGVAILNQFQNTKPQSSDKVSAQTLSVFLKLVVEGEQDQAEKLLKSF